MAHIAACWYGMPYSMHVDCFLMPVLPVTLWKSMKKCSSGIYRECVSHQYLLRVLLISRRFLDFTKGWCDAGEFCQAGISGGTEALSIVPWAPAVSDTVDDRNPA